MAAMPSIWGTAALAWRDTRRALVAMPALAGIAFAILTALRLVAALVEATVTGYTGLVLLMGLA